MGQCVSKRSSSSSPTSSSSSSASPSVVDETAAAPAVVKSKSVKSPPEDSRRRKSKLKKSSTFAKRSTQESNKSLEQCQNTSIFIKPSRSSSPHGGRVRPEPDHLAKVTTRRGVLLDEVPDPKPELELQEQSKQQQGSSIEDRSTSLITSSFLKCTSSESPLKRLNDLKLERKMLRDRFFSAGSDKEGLGQEVKNGYSTSPSLPVPAVVVPIKTLSAVPVTLTASPIPTSKTSPLPTSKYLEGVQGQVQHVPSPKSQSLIPRPAGPGAINTATTATSGDRLTTQSTKIPSGIPRFHSPNSSRGGQRGQLPMPISITSHQKETEDGNRFRVDSSYVVNKAGGGGFSGMSRPKQEKMVGLPNRPISAVTVAGLAQGRQGIEKKIIPTRSMYSPYKGSGDGQKLTGPNKYLVKKPQVTRPFYTILYQGAAKKSEAKPAKNGQHSQQTPGGGTKTLEQAKQDDDKAGGALILRSVTWTKEDDRKIAITPEPTNQPINVAERQSQLSKDSSTIPNPIPTSGSHSYTKFAVPQPQPNAREAFSRATPASATFVSDKVPGSISHSTKDQIKSVSHSYRGTVTATSIQEAIAVSPKLVSQRSRQPPQLNYLNPTTHAPHCISTEKLFHSSTSSSVLSSSNDNQDMSSDSDYLIDDEIEDQPDLITTTTTLTRDNNSSQFLASNIGSSESLQIESDYSDDDLRRKEKRIDLTGLLAKDGGQVVDREVICTTDSCEEEGLDKIEVISLHSDDTASNTSEKVDDVKSEACPVANNANAVNANTGLKSDTKVKRRLSAASRGTPSNKMVLDRTMSHELRSSHRSVAPPKKAVELPKTQKYPGTKNGTLKQDEARKTNEELLSEVQDLKRTLFQLKTVLEEQNRREKEKDEIINKLLKEVDQLKKPGSTEAVDTKCGLKPDAHRKDKVTDAGDSDTSKAVSHSELHHSHHSIAKSVIKKS